MKHTAETRAYWAAHARRVRAAWTPEQREAHLAKQRERRRTRPQAEQKLLDKRATVKKKYGITVEQYDEIVARPCGICGTTSMPRVVDHDHDTGLVRGALCALHNKALGGLGDTVAGLQKAIDYLNGAPA